MWRAPRVFLWTDWRGRRPRPAHPRWHWRLGILLCVALVVALVGALSGCQLGGSTSSSQAGRHTSQSTATPAGPSTPQDTLTVLARTALGQGAPIVQVTYDVSAQTAQVTATLKGPIPRTSAAIDQEHERVKTLAFQAQRAIWTSAIPLKQTTVIIQGPMLNDYAEPFIDAYGVSVLSAAKAATLDWSHESADMAWAAYDRVWLRPDYVPDF